MFVVKDAVREPLYAIVPYFNPWRWKSREKHTERAIKHFIDSGAVVVLVEVGFNRRELTFADSGLNDTPANCNVHGEGKFRHQYIGLHSKDELWLKENAINVAASRLPYDWQQMCWLDSDVHFLRPNWVGECIHKLQHFGFLQMFSHARDLGPNYEMLSQDYPHSDGSSFVQAWKDGRLDPLVREDLDEVKRDLKKLKKSVAKLEQDLLKSYYPSRIWPGLAWACTRWAWESVGGLIDFAIWGGGDWHMSHALIEKEEGMMLPGLHRNYRKLVDQWAWRCKTEIRKNVGVMEGSITHHWHGRKVERGYNAKHLLLARLGFDPPRHLKKDHQGLYQLHDDGSDTYTKMRDSMRVIAKERNEDSIDT